MKTFQYIKKYFLFFFLAFICLSCKNKDNKKLDNQNIHSPNIIDTVPFVMQDDRNSSLYNYNTIFVSIQLKDSSYYNFILDNCFSQTTIREDIFHTMYDISKFKIINHNSSFLNIVGNVEVKIGRYVLLLDTVAVLGNNLYTKFYKNKNFEGFLGRELFEKKIIEIDFDNKTLIIYNILPQKAQSYQVVDLLIEKQKWGKIFPRVKLKKFIGENKNNLSGKFLVDLGAPETILFPLFRDQVSLDCSKYDTVSLEWKLLNWTILNNEERALVNHVGKDGTSLLQNDKNDGIIGIDFLKNFDVIFDYPHNKLYLKPNKYFKP